MLLLSTCLPDDLRTQHRKNYDSKIISNNTLAVRRATDDAMCGWQATTAGSRDWISRATSTRRSFNSELRMVHREGASTTVCVANNCAAPTTLFATCNLIVGELCVFHRHPFLLGLQRQADFRHITRSTDTLPSWNRMICTTANRKSPTHHAPHWQNCLILGRNSIHSGSRPSPATMRPPT